MVEENNLKENPEDKDLVAKDPKEAVGLVEMEVKEDKIMATTMTSMTMETMVETRTMIIVKVEGQGYKKKTIGVILIGRNSLHFIFDCQS